MGLLDRDNFFAVAWGISYAFSVVLVVGLLDAVGIAPTVAVPVAVVILPIVVGLALWAIERRWNGRADG